MFRGGRLWLQSAAAGGPRCVVALFANNDLRLHDNYAVTLAVERAKELGVPLIGAFCFDDRCFAQPSLVAGFYRASPKRARFLIEAVADLRRSLHEQHSELYVRVGRPEEEISRLVREIGGGAEVFCTTQYAPHEEMVQRAIDEALSTLPGPARSRLTAVWNTTMVHVDDLVTPPELMREQCNAFHAEVEKLQLRRTEPFDTDDGRMRALGNSRAAVEAAAPHVAPGALPDQRRLGYGHVEDLAMSADGGIGHQFVGGESAAMARLQQFVDVKNLGVYRGFGLTNREKRFHIDDLRQSHLSPWISHGCLSPRLLMERLFILDHDNAGRGMTSDQIRVIFYRLCLRDYCHFVGIKWGRRLFFPYGPRPEDTDDVPDFRLDRGIIQRWCNGLTGFPFVDAGMRELTSTGWASNIVRESLIWFLARGFGQDWRVGAEWLERNSLDYDPFVNYHWCAYEAGLIKDRLGPRVLPGMYNAYRTDGKGLYVKTWIPQLARIPEAYIHRPHVISDKMQRMYQLYLGQNYPYPVKLWRGAQREFERLPAYFTGAGRGAMSPGVDEARRFNADVLSKADAHPCVTGEAMAALEDSTAPLFDTEREPEFAMAPRRKAGSQSAASAAHEDRLLQM